MSVPGIEMPKVLSSVETSVTMSNESSMPSVMKSFEAVKSNSGRISFNISPAASCAYHLICQDMVNQSVRRIPVMLVFLNGVLIAGLHPEDEPADGLVRLKIMAHQTPNPAAAREMVRATAQYRTVEVNP